MSSMYPQYGGSPPGRACQRCGAPLAPNEVYCANCGNYNAPASAPTEMAQGPSSNAWGGSLPPTGYGQNAYPGQQWGQQPSSPSGFAPYSSPSSPQQSYGMPNGSSPNNYYNAAPQSPYPAPSTMGGFQSGNFPPPAGPGGYAPPQKGGPRVGLIIGIVILLLVLVAGGIGGYLYLKSSRSATNNPGASPTAAPATATPSGPPLFSDTFANNSNNWDLTSAQGKFTVKVGGGSLVLEDDENRLLPELIPNKTFDDFRLTVDATLTKGDPNSGYGVFIRGATDQNSNLTSYYRFELYGDGTYAIFKGSLDSTGASKSDKLVGYLESTAIQKGGSLNHITITAKGPDMAFFVNGQLLHSVNDSSYKSGAAALFVSNLPQTPPGAQATFTNLAVYPAA